MYSYEISKPINESYGGYEKEVTEGKIYIPKRDKCVLVNVYNESELCQSFKLGYVDTEEIYKQINNGEKINLNYTIISDFSIKILVELYPNSIKDGYVEINELEAINSIWRTVDNDEIDFKQIKSMGNKFNFNGVVIKNTSIYFSNSVFDNVSVEFNCVTADNGIYFDDSYFKNNLIFQESSFKRLSFSGARFGSGTINFINLYINYATFDFLETNFENACVIFRNFTLNTDTIVNFWRVNSTATVCFYDINFENDVSLEFNTCKNLIIQKCKIQKSLNIDIKEITLKSFSLLKTLNFGQIHINNKKLLTEISNSKLCIFNDTSDANNYSFDNTSISEKKEQYVLLKENFNYLSQYEYEDFCYYKYKVCNRKNKPMNISRAIEFILQDCIGKYGTDWLSTLIAMPIIIIIFSIILAISNTGITFDSVSQLIYSSALYFFSFQLYDQIPLTSIGKAILLLEGFIGAFMVSYFTVCFARKSLR